MRSSPRCAIGTFQCSRICSVESGGARARRRKSELTCTTIVFDLTSPFSQLPKLMLVCPTSRTDRTQLLRMTRSLTGRSPRSVLEPAAWLSNDRSKSASLMKILESARLALVETCGRVLPFGVMMTINLQVERAVTESERAGTSLPLLTRFCSSFRSDMYRLTYASSSSSDEWVMELF